MSWGSLFQTEATTTMKAQLPIEERRVAGMTSKDAEHRCFRPATSVAVKIIVYLLLQWQFLHWITFFIIWQPRRAVDTSMNWWQSLFCCCTASMEQATDGAETAAIDELVSSWSKNISVSFCLRAPGYGLTLWCALGLLVGVGGAIQVPQLQLQLQLSVINMSRYM